MCFGTFLQNKVLYINNQMESAVQRVKYMEIRLYVVLTKLHIM